MPDPYDPKRRPNPGATPAPRPPTKPATPPTPPDAYELEEKKTDTRAPQSRKPPAPSYLTDEAGAPKLSVEEQRLLGAKKMLGMAGPSDPRPLKEVKAVDAAAAAEKRDEARRKAAEEWAAEDIKRRNRRIVVGLVMVAILTAIFFYAKANWGWESVWDMLGLEPPR